jgi:hypothetical protein
MAREVIAWLVINASVTFYLAYCNLSRVAPLSDDDRQLYDDL